MEKKKGIIAEFKEFISRGNVIDLAVGVVMGSSFTAIVNSIVNDIVLPFIGWIFGGVNFTTLRLVIREATETTAEAAINYGNFIQAIVNFLVIAVVIFAVVKIMNKFRKKKEEPKPEPPKPSKEAELLQEILDTIKEK